jgi:hypothetical protein
MLRGAIRYESEGRSLEVAYERMFTDTAIQVSRADQDWDY